MRNTNIITATYIPGGPAVTQPLVQWDYGQILELVDFPNLPIAFEMHFANIGDSASATTIGRNGQVEIPNGYLETGLWIDCWLFLHETASDGETEYHISIPVIAKAEPDNPQPTPEQESAITQAIAALQEGVSRSETAASSAEQSAASAKAYRDDIDELLDEAVAEVEASAERAETAARYAESENISAAQWAHAAEADAAGAAADAETARNAALSAKADADRAEQAATTAGYLDMYIDEEGYLCYVRTPQVSIDFELDAQGYLVMKGA